MAMDAVALDQARVEAFMGKMIENFSGTMTTLLCVLGDRLGLFGALAEQGSAPAGELARRAGVHDRYALELLSGLAAAEYLEYDVASDRYVLAPEHQPAFVQEAGPMFLCGGYQMVHGMLKPFDRLRALRDARRSSASSPGRLRSRGRPMLVPVRAYAARVLGDALWHRPGWRRFPGWLRRFAGIGALPSDAEETRLRKSVLVLSSSLMATLAFVWVGTYAALGLWVSAAIPFAYQLASAASISTFARERRYRLFRTSQLGMSLVLPFALQWSLGGFRNSSAVALWGLTSPVGALLFVGARQAVPWFLAFAALVAVSAAIDPALAASARDIPNGAVVTFFALNVLGVSTTVYVLLQYFVRARDRALADSERLLLNVLPSPVARRLKQSDQVIADGFPAASVLFADIVGFTGLAERLAPADVVALLDRVFAGWDGLAARHGVEKIKTIGDAYMVAGGLPSPREDHAEAIADMALEMGPEITRCAAESGQALEVRIGIDTGPVVAGVIGRSKFIYDLWGDTVNTASRMESHGLPGSIQVTERAYERLRDRYDLRERGTIEVKGKGPMTTYLLIGRRDRPNAKPNEG